jgi:hypothetical protein
MTWSELKCNNQDRRKMSEYTDIGKAYEAMQLVFPDCLHNTSDTVIFTTLTNLESKAVEDMILPGCWRAIRLTHPFQAEW